MLTVLALSAIAFNLGVIGFSLCVVLIVYASGIARSASSSAEKPNYRIAVLVGALLFLTIWLWLWPSAMLLAWLLWIGDNNHWFYDGAAQITAGIAVVIASYVACRISLRRVTAGHLRIVTWSCVLLLLLWGIVWTIEFSEPILGTDPRSAAEAYARIEGATLVEFEPDNDEWRAGCVGYRVFKNEEPRGAVIVCPHGWFWWRLGFGGTLPPSRAVLAKAKELLQLPDHPANRDQAIRLLRRIMKDYPNTESAREASELLEAIETRER